jgi:hypothetical protein
MGPSRLRRRSLSPRRPSESLCDAIRVYLANREATVAHPTYRKYKTFPKHLQAFADSRGYICIDQFRPDDIDIYFTGSSLGPVTKAKKRPRQAHRQAAIHDRRVQEARYRHRYMA